MTHQLFHSVYVICQEVHPNGEGVALFLSKYKAEKQEQYGEGLFHFFKKLPSNMSTFLCRDLAVFIPVVKNA